MDAVAVQSLFIAERNVALQTDRKTYRPRYGNICRNSRLQSTNTFSDAD